MEVVGRHDKMNDAEKKVLKWLEDSFILHDGRILVEPGFRRTKYQEWPDFVILSPTHGVLIIECKGHYSEEIRKVSNTDLMTSRGVDRYGKQLASYGCLFRDMLKNFPVNIHKFVVFPEILTTDKAADYISEFNSRYDDVQVLYNENLDWTCSFEHLGVHALKQKLKKAGYDELVSLLNPTRVVEHNYTLDMNQMSTLKLLDVQQTELLEKITDGHYLLNGLPGTGKTILLMQLAERELNNKKSVLYVCFNKPLNEYVASMLGEKVAKTTQSLYYNLALKLGAEKEELLKGYDKSIEFLLKQKLKPIYDVILVDEYQDLEDEDYQILTKLVPHEGLLVLGGDRLQNIRSNKETWKSKGINVASGKKRSKFLKKPYRTDPDVVDFALTYLCTNPALAKEAKNYFEEYEFEHVSGDLKNLRSKLKFMIYSTLEFKTEIEKIKKVNPQAQILVVTPDPEHNKVLAVHRSPNVRVETFLRAKGLEADIVILYGIDNFKNTKDQTIPLTDQQKMRSLFSALCRSRGDIYIHGYNPKDYYADLKNVFINLIKSKTA